MTTSPERWRIDAGDAALARLDIPAHASRERVFEISCAMSVRVSPGAAEPWHEMQVLADGAVQWQRRVPSRADPDGLDLRLRRVVPVGQALRLTVKTACQGGRRQSLRIEADEV